ncbi:MAG: DUF4292 domain-containing protein [Dysgonamonadaceae bacterium]|jgi:hypothetical protein|nr:DUF4292 domain-containing protein [Dysgonamonadaceae bacterium]
MKWNKLICRRRDGMRAVKYIVWGLCCGLAIFASSCRTSRQIHPVALTGHTVEERVGLIVNRPVSYKTFSSALRFGIKSGVNRDSITADARLRIVKDEMIQLSLRIPILGTEAARINISPDQILIIDRMNKRYFVESMENLKKHLPFDFDYYSVQSLFTNQLFIAGKQEVTPDDYASFGYREDEFSAVLSRQDSRGIVYDFTGDYSHRILKTEVYKNDKTVSMNWNYADFERVSDNCLFPMKMSMALTVPDNLISMNLNFSSVDIDAAFELKTDIPSKYKQIDINQLIKLIRSL